MKVIRPSYEILSPLDSMDMATRLESCGRLCYKSEDRITPESAGPFVQNVIKKGHNSVLEMAVLTLGMRVDKPWKVERFLAHVNTKFLHITRSTCAPYMLITGSVRALRDAIINYGTPDTIVINIREELQSEYPHLFGVPDAPPVKIHDLIPVREVPLSEVDKFSPELLAKHRHVAVKFITNRDVTHEIVRHRPAAYLQESQRYCGYDGAKFGGELTFIKPCFYDEWTPEYVEWTQAMKDAEKHYLYLRKTSSPQAARTVLPNSCKAEIIVFSNLEQWKHVFKLRTSKAADPSIREIMVPLQNDMAKLYPWVIEPYVE